VDRQEGYCVSHSYHYDLAVMLAVDAVLRNRSPRTKFPANRENNWEHWLFRRNSVVETCAFSAPYGEIP
jgi:hypothetical protein